VNDKRASLIGWSAVEADMTEKEKQGFYLGRALLFVWRF